MLTSAETLPAAPETSLENVSRGAPRARKGAKLWKHTAGARGYQCTVYERVPGGMIWGARLGSYAYGRAKGGLRRASLSTATRRRRGPTRRGRPPS